MAGITNDWLPEIQSEFGKPYYKRLYQFVRQEYSAHVVYPPSDQIFNALHLTPLKDVRVVILGQDPYHEPGQACGLAFSVPAGTVMPPSLVNILKELQADTGITPEEADADDPAGVLGPWARSGVLLLNTILTVRAHQAASHRGLGWEQFTDRIIELLAERQRPMVFVLWGAHARSKKPLIVEAQQRTSPALRHLIIEAPHPSPLSAHRGFFGGSYFSRCNYFLEDSGIEPIDWHL